MITLRKLKSIISQVEMRMIRINVVPKNLPRSNIMFFSQGEKLISLFNSGSKEMVVDDTIFRTKDQFISLVFSKKKNFGFRKVLCRVETFLEPERSKAEIATVLELLYRGLNTDTNTSAAPVLYVPEGKGNVFDPLESVCVIIAYGSLWWQGLGPRELKILDEVFHIELPRDLKPGESFNATSVNAYWDRVVHKESRGDKGLQLSIDVNSAPEVKLLRTVEDLDRFFREEENFFLDSDKKRKKRAIK